MNPKTEITSSEVYIGIVGPRKITNLTQEVLRNFPNIRPKYLIIETADDFDTAIKPILESVELLIFTESYLYDQIKQTFNFDIPVHYIPLTETGLYRSLFLARDSFGLKSISIDSVVTETVNEIYKDLNEVSKIYSFELNSDTDIDALIDFHKKSYENHQSFAFTGIQQVSTQLHRIGVPNELMIPTKLDVIVSLERALLATQSRKNKEGQIIFGLVHIDEFSSMVSHYESETEVQLLKLKFQKLLIDYIETLDGYMTNTSGEEFSFITTRGIFERESRGYKFIPLLHDTKQQLGFTISLGIGFGTTASEAGKHARIALGQSKDSGGNVCYIVREDRRVFGPVDSTSRTQYEKYSLSITNPLVLEKAEQSGMSASYMSKLMARVSRHKKIDYTAQELADTLDITIRSAHRILLKWMDANLVTIIGEEKLTNKGRPRRVYRLIFVNNEAFK